MYPDEYVEYLIEFHARRDYFECHEILEEYWKSQPSSLNNEVWVGFIQLAVSLYHHRRGNFAGAVKMMKGAIRILSRYPDQIIKLGINDKQLLRQMKKRLLEQEQHISYTSMDLPIADQRLIEKCQDLCDQMGLKWGNSVNESDPFLIHKHSLRDRSDVIGQRKKHLQLKRYPRE